MIETLVAGLAVWRATSLLVCEDGPLGLFREIRKRAGVYDLGPDGKPRSFFGELLECFWCISFWLSLPAATLVGGRLPLLLSWLAVSAVSILLDEVISCLIQQHER